MAATSGAVGTTALPTHRAVSAFSSDGWAKAAFRAIAVVCAARFVWSGVQIRYANQTWLYRIPDDAFYYLEIGQRIADGQGVTFDGIHRTNGFQPLWQLMVAGLALVWSGTALVRATLLAQLVLVAFAVIVATRLVEQRWGHLAAAGCLVVATALTFTSRLLDGMEAALALAAVVAMVALVARDLERPDTRYPGQLIGLGAGLLVWSRVDFLLPLVVALPLLSLAGPRRLRRLLVSTATAAAVTVPYFAWNVLLFGHLFSVRGPLELHTMATTVSDRYGSRLSSGYLGLLWDQARSVWHQALAAANPLSGGAAAPLGALLLWTPVVLGLLFLCRKGVATRTRPRVESEGVPPSDRLELWARRDPLPVAAAFGALVLLLHFAMGLAVLPLRVTGWHSLPLRAAFALATGAALGSALDAAARRWGTPARGATVLVMVTLLLLAGWPSVGEARHQRAESGAWQTEVLRAAQWARSYRDFTGSIDGGGLLGAYDAGLLGFELHDRGVVDLDGQVNDYAYADLLMSPSSRDDVLERHRRTGVYYLIGRLAPGDPLRPSCATVIWKDPVPVAYRGDVEGVTTVPVVVLEVGGSCGLDPEVIR